ncbi:MAG: aldehyde ferredoxin oxidoreductase family protein [Chloroflexi bacterium]|nr:aldehyde ferredoxin oxidoreductase family protein [Chloroflexota bacterium]
MIDSKLNGGYTGRVLWVNLTKGQTAAEALDADVARKFIGGAGLASRIIWDKTDKDTEALSPENLLIFAVGPLTGTSVPMNSHYTVAAISPLTGIWGEGHSGGTWAYQLKHAGFDAVVFSGKASKPVYLFINNGKTEIRDAGRVWGKGVFDTSDMLQAETDPKASVACIGPAGEKLARIACIINEGRIGRAAARCGLGAVMGSKNLKAVVVRGTDPLKVYDREGLHDSAARFNQRSAEQLKDWKSTARRRSSLAASWQKGRLNFQNYLGNDLPGFKDSFIETLQQGEEYYCTTCPRSHAECRLVNGRRRVLWEAMGPLGAQCCIADVKALQEAQDLCQDYGVDTISAGGVMSFAIEVFEKGLITRADTDGVVLGWGNAPGMLQMLKKTLCREGFGSVLAEGVRRAAEQIAPVAMEYAVHVKGMELAAHNPRGSNAIALENATANRGADHLSANACMDTVDYPELGISAKEHLIGSRFKVEGQGQMVARLQDFSCLIDSVVICKLIIQPGPMGLQPGDLVEWMNLATGWDMDLKELMTAGERIFNQQRLINTRKGISRKDDFLHPRLLTHKLGGTIDCAQHLPPIGELLNQYYANRGWSEEGLPTNDKLASLGLRA